MPLNIHRAVPLLLGVLLLASASADTQAQESDTQNSARDIRAMVEIGPLEIHGNNHGERVVIGRDVTLNEGETNRGLVVIFGDATIDGTVSGEMVSILGNVKIGPTGRIKHPMVLVGGRADIHPDAEFRGFNGPTLMLPVGVLHGIRDWLTQGLLLGRPIPHQSKWIWALAAVFLMFYLLITALLPRPVQSCVAVLEARPATSFLAGILALLLAGPLIALLAVSMVGLLVLPFLICGMAAGFIIGRVAVYRFAGQTLGGQVGMQLLQSPLPSLVIGATLFALLYAVPILGFLAWGLVGTLGTGAALIAGAKSLRFEFPESNVPGIPNLKATDTKAPAATTEATLAQPGVDIALLPRMGFWIRLGATLMDVMIVGILLRIFVRDVAEIFLPAWIIYHLILWTWKGTTLGGLVFRLQIVRLSGERINFAVALVRCLSAFFSAIVFCLGFFWVGWSRDRQSWHDVISGTVIVRLPPGASLV